MPRPTPEERRAEQNARRGRVADQARVQQESERLADHAERSQIIAAHTSLAHEYVQANEHFKDALAELEAAGKEKVEDTTAARKLARFEARADEELEKIAQGHPDKLGMEKIRDEYLEFLRTVAGIRFARSVKRFEQFGRRRDVWTYKLMDFERTHLTLLWTRRVRKENGEFLVPTAGRIPAASVFWNALGSVCCRITRVLDSEAESHSRLRFLLDHHVHDLFAISDIRLDLLADETIKPELDLLIYIVSKTGRSLVRDMKFIQAIAVIRPKDDILHGAADYLESLENVPFHKPEFAKAITDIAYTYPFLLNPEPWPPHQTQHSLAASLSKRRRTIYGFV